MTLKLFLLIILHEFCSTAEQIFFKKGADRLNAHSLGNWRDYLSFIFRVLKMPAVWIAFIMTLLSWVIWFTVLAGAELSIAVPVDSMQYIMIMAVSYFLLKERIHWTRLVGTAFIILGVALVVLS